ncbi:MAG: MinD/ParA family protein [Lachnospiraceae bacterium]|jgi:flagellar biosynthesis protein FlhG|nr:MinD/ParA family protein [Lachnospiraceae bacterium]
MDQAEQLRNVIKKRTKSLAQDARVIVVTSGKGGVGKSNISINLAIQLKMLGSRVLIFDADFGLANIEVMFGKLPKYTLADVIYQGKPMKDIITWGPMDVGFISAGSGIAGLNNLNKESIHYLIKNLSDLDSIADIIIIDTGAGISNTVLEFLVSGGEILLVTTPDPSSITDSYSLLKVLCRHPHYQKENTFVKLIANQVETLEEGEQLYNKLNSVIKKYLDLQLDYLGMIPLDSQLSKAVLQQNPVSLQSPNAKSSRAFQTLAEKIAFGQASGIKKGGIKEFFAQFLNIKS